MSFSPLLMLRVLASDLRDDATYVLITYLALNGISMTNLTK